MAWGKHNGFHPSAAVCALCHWGADKYDYMHYICAKRDMAA